MRAARAGASGQPAALAGRHLARSIAREVAHELDASQEGGGAVVIAAEQQVVDGCARLTLC